jgi:hypothetical protein
MRRFRAAGLAPVGLSTVPEFGFALSSEPPGGPVARNPFDEGRTPGGSSGGAAAAVAGGIVAHGPWHRRGGVDPGAGGLLRALGAETLARGGGSGADLRQSPDGDRLRRRAGAVAQGRGGGFEATRVTRAEAISA